MKYATVFKILFIFFLFFQPLDSFEILLQQHFVCLYLIWRHAVVKALVFVQRAEIHDHEMNFAEQAPHAAIYVQTKIVLAELTEYDKVNLIKRLLNSFEWFWAWEGQGWEFQAARNRI